MVATDRHNPAPGNEVTGDGNGLIWQTAWTIAKVEDESPKLAMRLLLDRFYGCLQCIIRMIRELRQSHITDLVWSPAVDTFDHARRLVQTLRIRSACPSGRPRPRTHCCGKTPSIGNATCGDHGYVRRYIHDLGSKVISGSDWPCPPASVPNGTITSAPASFASRA